MFPVGRTSAHSFCILHFLQQFDNGLYPYTLVTQEGHSLERLKTLLVKDIYPCTGKTHQLKTVSHFEHFYHYKTIFLAYIGSILLQLEHHLWSTTTSYFTNLHLMTFRYNGKDTIPPQTMD